MFCSNCGKEIRQGANFCMYCGAPVDKIENTAKVEKTEEPLKTPVAEKEEGNGEYSNCENGKVSFLKMLKKFFSKDIKEYFSFDGTYSRLEYFYARVIIYIALFAIVVSFKSAPELYMLIAVPLTVAFIWLLAASYIKRLKDLNVTLWVMLIPPTCGLLINRGGEGFAIIATIVLIYYQACILFLKGEKFKEQNEDGADYEKTNDETEESEEDVEKEKAGKIIIKDLFLFLMFGMIIYAFIAILSKG